MKQIKNFLMLFVMMMFVANVHAQYMGNIVAERGPGYIVTNAGYVYDTDDIPGSNKMGEGDNILRVMNKHWNYLRRNNPEEYTRQYNVYTLRVMKGIQPIEIRSIGGTGTMMMSDGAGMVMMGNGGTGAGMVMGAGGMASATSSVHIDNENLVSTAGSGIYMDFDSSTGNVNISGDPFMAIGRIASAIGGSKKAKNQQQVVYVDSRTGQVIGTQTRQQGTQTRQQTTNSGVASQPVYNVYSGF